MPSIRIFAALPSPVVHKAVVALLTTNTEIDICGNATEGNQAVSKIIETQPDIALLDKHLPGVNGLQASRLILQQTPTQKILAIADTDSDTEARETMLAGAMGLLSQENIGRDLLPAIDALNRGRTFFTVRRAERFLKEYLKEKSVSEHELLTHREHEMVQALAREVATSLSHLPRKQSAPIAKYIAMSVLLISVGVAALLLASQESEQMRSEVDRWLVALGMKASPPPLYSGNPDARVWIDVQTALYYCSGNPLYGKTANGRYVKQRDALMDHFEPAERKGCE
jgi:DNA-binding NarL/FixJ family response regulator